MQTLLNFLTECINLYIINIDYLIDIIGDAYLQIGHKKVEFSYEHWVYVFVVILYYAFDDY